MRANVRSGGVALCALLLVACAGAPPRSAAPAPAALPTPAAPAPGAGTTPVLAHAGSAGPDAAIDPTFVRAGYRVVKRADRVLYCRTESSTGTAFSSTVCLTAEQLREQKRSLQQSQDSLTQPHGITCSVKLCNGG